MKSSKTPEELQRNRGYREKYRNKYRVHIYEYLKTHPCTDCGISDPVVLEFDHVGDKKFGIGVALSNGGVTIEELQNEMRKCEVVCANCHKRRTAARSGWWKL